MVKILKASYSYDVATNVIVGGGSAGGLAAYLHLDWYASQAPATATVRGMPDSGFFEDGNYTRDGKPDYDADMANLYQFQNSAVSVPSACVAALGYKCLFAYHLIPYIKTPIFALNSAYDATMGPGQCGADSGIVMDWNNNTAVNLCGNYVRSQLKQLLKPPSAVFLDSCHHHCGEWNQITILKLTCSKALQLWYQGGASALPNDGYMDQDQPYPCNSCCSP